MLKGLTLIFVMLFATSLVAQAPELELMGERSSKDERYDKFVFHKGQHLYALSSDDSKSETKEFYVSKYAVEGFKKEQEWVFAGFSFKKSNTNLWESYANRDGIQLFFTAYVGKEDTKYLLHRSVDFNGNISPVKVLSKMVSNKKTARDFILKFSLDSSKVGVYNDVDDKGNQGIPLITVFDTDFSQLWSQRIRTPFKDGEIFTPVSIKISNNGKLFILGYRAKRSTKDSKARKTEQYGLISFYDEEVLTYDLKALNATIHTIGMQPDVAGHLVMTGLYGDEFSADVTGSLYVKLNQSDLSEVVSKLEGFSEEFLDNFDFIKFRAISQMEGVLTGNASSELRGFDGFKYDFFLVEPDGGLTIVASRYYKKIVASQGMVTTLYNYEAIMPMHFDSSGSISWLTVIPRDQTLSDRDFFGFYHLHEIDGKLHVIFNDIITNKEAIAEGKPMQALGGSFAGAAKMGTADVIVNLSNGLWTYEVISKFNDTNKTFLAPRELMRINSNLAVGAYKNLTGKKVSFVKYRF